MPYSVGLTADAAQDLVELYTYIDSHDVSGKADYVLDEIEKLLVNLEENPSRGVFVLMIIDGRRDMELLLQRRLLG